MKYKISTFQLHTNLKAVEGSVACPVVGVSTPKKPRKSKTNSVGMSAISDPYNMDTAEESDLPTQVKLKSRFTASVKPSLPARLGTPPGDKNHSGPRITLPIPMSFTQGLPVPLELRNQAGQDSFIASLSDTNQLHQGSFSPYGYPQNSAAMSHDRDNAPVNGKQGIDAYQRELMQIPLQANPEKNYTSAKQNHLQPSCSPTMSNMSEIQTRDGKLTSPQTTKSQHLSANPSHITHHFPKVSSSSAAITRSDSQSIYNPAFSPADSTLRQTSYRSNQY